MGKTLLINLSNLKLKGDVLDITCEDHGVIYNISKDIDDEISADYIEGDSETALKNREYDACTLFFSLSKLWKNESKENLIEDISKHIKINGKIYIWDINKNIGEIVDNSIKVVLPKGDLKEFKIKNLNPFSSSNIEETKKILEKSYKIDETRIWEEMHFIEGTKL